MQDRDSSVRAPKRAVVVSPNSRMAEELDHLLRTRVPGIAINYLRSYPAATELAKTLSATGPTLLFIDVISDIETALRLITEVGQSGARVNPLALLSRNDPDFILRCLRAGAADFLLQPFSDEQLDAVLVNLTRLQPNEKAEGREPGKIFAVMPAKGACGASTIACNLAFECKRLGASRVLLADLDALTGTISFLLKVNSATSFMDALNRQHELDADLWNSIVKPVHGVDVLLAPDLLPGGSAHLKDPGPLLEYARYNYDVVVTDASGVYGDWNLNQAKIASEVLLIVTNELPALQAAQRALSYLETNKVGRWKLKLIVNRHHRDAGLSKEIIATALNMEVFETLPSDYVTVQKALLEGKTVPPGTPLGKSITALTDRLRGSTRPVPEPKKSSPFSDLLNLFSRTK